MESRLPSRRRILRHRACPGVANPLRWPIVVVTVCQLGICISQLAVATGVYATVAAPTVGAWWATILPFACAVGLMFTILTQRSFLKSDVFHVVCWIGIIAGGLSGLLVDFLALQSLHRYTACEDSAGIIYGSGLAASLLTQCPVAPPPRPTSQAVQIPAGQCLCLQPRIDTFLPPWCIDSSSATLYQPLRADASCNVILTTYPDALQLCLVLDVAVLAATALMAILVAAANCTSCAAYESDVDAHANVAYSDLSSSASEGNPGAVTPVAAALPPVTVVAGLFVSDYVLLASEEEFGEPQVAPGQLQLEHVGVA